MFMCLFLAYVTAPKINFPWGPSCQKLRYINHSMIKSPVRIAAPKHYSQTKFLWSNVYVTAPKINCPNKKRRCSVIVLGQRVYLGGDELSWSQEGKKWKGERKRKSSCSPHHITVSHVLAKLSEVSSMLQCCYISLLIPWTRPWLLFLPCPSFPWCCCFLAVFLAAKFLSIFECFRLVFQCF